MVVRTQEGALASLVMFDVVLLISVFIKTALTERLFLRTSVVARHRFISWFPKSRGGCHSVGHDGRSTPIVAFEEEFIDWNLGVPNGQPGQEDSMIYVYISNSDSWGWDDAKGFGDTCPGTCRVKAYVVQYDCRD